MIYINQPLQYTADSKRIRIIEIEEILRLRRQH